MKIKNIDNVYINKTFDYHMYNFFKYIIKMGYMYNIIYIKIDDENLYKKIYMVLDSFCSIDDCFNYKIRRAWYDRRLCLVISRDININIGLSYVNIGNFYIGIRYIKDYSSGSFSINKDNLYINNAISTQLIFKKFFYKFIKDCISSSIDTIE